MKKAELKQIIKDEISKVLNENTSGYLEDLQQMYALIATDDQGISPDVDISSLDYYRNTYPREFDLVSQIFANDEYGGPGEDLGFDAETELGYSEEEIRGI